MFLKSKTKIDRKRLSKSRYSTKSKIQARFLRRGKSLVKNFWDSKERSSKFMSFEGKRINFGAGKPKLWQFEIRCFCDKMRPFCTISTDTFGKSTQIYIF